jgi:hypothetical protein
VTLNFKGDWGMFDFHRICSWLTAQFRDRAGPESQVAIWNCQHGGIDAVTDVFNGRMQLDIATPAQLMSLALEGKGIFVYAIASVVGCTSPQRSDGSSD